MKASFKGLVAWVLRIEVVCYVRAWVLSWFVCT